MREHLELPRPLRLLRTVLWSLTESAGLPLGAAALGAWLYGRDVGLLAGLVATWLTALIRKIATGSVPSLLTISAVVLTLQTAIVLSTGQLWLYLLQFPVANLIMCVLFARTARGPSPLVARLAAEVVALRQPGDHPGLHRFFQGATWLWAGIFFLLTAGSRRADGDRAHQAVHHALDRAHARPGGGRGGRVGAVVPGRPAPLRHQPALRGRLTGPPFLGRGQPSQRVSVGLSSSRRASRPFTNAGEPSVDRSRASWTASLIATASGMSSAHNNS